MNYHPARLRGTNALLRPVNCCSNAIHVRPQYADRDGNRQADRFRHADRRGDRPRPSRTNRQARCRRARLVASRARRRARARAGCSIAGRARACCTACRSASRTSSTATTSRRATARRSTRRTSRSPTPRPSRWPRAAGAILLGKTVTTEFANRHPGKTRNPHNPGAYAGRLVVAARPAAVADCRCCWRPARRPAAR